MKIGILGTGRVATTLGERLISRGHTLVYGSREPASGSATQQDAVSASDIVITAIPGAAVLGTLDALGDDALTGKILLDPSVPVGADGQLLFPGDSLARRVQERFPALRVVKTLNTMNTSMMTDSADTVANPMVFVSGDDPDAKATVRELLHDLGWSDQDILDLGGVETAVGTEHAFHLFFGVLTALQSPQFTLSVTR
ncbi:oxidoreductase [Micrococcus luteus]|uniref:NADPH-dependent F420 reductase n=1 Tax=Micrococcus luteus TaxID=1270 RepID=UPI000D504953|nr:NAD(P)-binding domain-containing protein [Micrococcus luteus]AWD24133.1 oxidoreductase [Micrococcus luteus]